MSTTSDRGAVVLLGTLIALTVIGSSAVAVAIPVVRADLGLSVSDAAWIFSVFSLCFAVATATFGRIADLVGLRTPLVVGVCLMAAGSVLVGVAPSLPVLLAGRVVQGVGAGAVPVLVNGIVAARWQGATRTAMFGSLLAVVATVSGSGPVIGGGIEAALGWRWVFALPAVSVALIAPIARLAPSDRGSGHFDVAGAVATSAMIAGLLAVLQAPTAGAVVGAVGVALLAVGVPAVILIASRRPDGFLPREVIANGRIMRAAVATLALLATYFAMLLAVPELLAAERGWSPLQIGLALLPAAAAGAVASQITGRVAPTVGRGRTASSVALVALAGVAVASASPTSVVALVVGMSGASIGFAASQAALVDEVVDVAPARVQGAALGVFNMVTFVGGSMGPAVIGGLSGVVGLPVAVAATTLGPLGALALLGLPRLRQVSEALSD
ncbi:MAG TPA: MFS transporter [Euzebyales bacterium]